jgi:general secretion pathway protein G
VIAMQTKLPPSRRGGFSLIEVLVVVVIITILAAVVAVNVMDTPDQAKVAATRATLQNVKTMLAKYALDQGAVPTQQQGLQALVEPSTLAPTPQRFPPGGYLSKLPVDGWGRPLQFLSPGRKGQIFELLSLGKDGALGGAGPDADLTGDD